jgi:hypothetical protein
MDNARDVIARAAYEAKPNAHYNRKPAAWDDLPYHGWDGVQADHRQRADAIIAALNDAGFEIVQRDTYIPSMLDPTMPENEIEVRSDVDSVWVKFVPIQKPEPDWGRRGTQPKGTLGDPPPPNGKLVATKPKPE